MKLGGGASKSGAADLAFNPLRGLRALQVGAAQSLREVPWVPSGAWHRIPGERPDAIVGTKESLRHLCRHLAAWHLDFRFVERAVFVLTGVGERPLNDHVRDELWHLFGVPVFELFVGGDGVILAHECEAHDGWHVNGSAAQFMKLRGEPHLVLRRPTRDGGHMAIGVGFTGAVTRHPCACGLETQRVVNLPTREPSAEERFVQVPVSVPAPVPLPAPSLTPALALARQVTGKANRTRTSGQQAAIAMVG